MESHVLAHGFELLTLHAEVRQCFRNLVIARGAANLTLDDNPRWLPSRLKHLRQTSGTHKNDGFITF